MSNVIACICVFVPFIFVFVFLILDCLFDVNYRQIVSFRRFKRDMRHWFRIKKVSYRFYRDFFYPEYERELDKVYNRLFDSLSCNAQEDFLRRIENENKK